MPPAAKKSKSSIKDVAEAANVSRTAVSLVLNNGEIRISDEKRKAILDAAKKLGYRPHTGARRLARQKTDTIGLVYPYDPSALSQLFLFELTRDIAEAAKAGGYDILIDFFHSAQPDTLVTDPGRVDGTILIRERNTPGEIELALEQTPHPCIVIGGGFMQHRPKNYVDIDVKAGSYDVTKHLIELGHKRIAFIGGVPSPIKYEGHQLAMKEAGLKPGKAIVLKGSMAEKEIEAVVDGLLNRQPWPTAIVAANDTLAVRMIRIFHRKGLHVPGDLSIVGFDDIEPAHLIIPSLTTIRIPTKELAETAITSLIQRVEGTQSKPVQKTLPTELIVRQSSGPAPSE